MPHLNKFSPTYGLMLVFVFLSILVTAHAQFNGQKRITIQSNALTMLYHQGLDIYQGNVEVQQGNSQLTGHSMYAYRNQHHKLYKILINGQPATLTISPSESSSTLYAHAQTLLINPQLHSILLLGQAHARRGNNIINAPLISYDTQKALLKAYQHGRSSVTISSEQRPHQGS